MKRGPRGFGSIIKMKGRRRKPYMVRVQSGVKLDMENGTAKQQYYIVGYAETRAKAMTMLVEWNENPVRADVAGLTFAEVYEQLKTNRLDKINQTTAKSYQQSFNNLPMLHDKKFRELNSGDYEKAFVVSKKNYPTLRKMKVLLNQMYDYAMKNDFCSKDYSQYIDMSLFNQKNPNAFNRQVFSKEQINELWKHSNNKYYQVILILIYTGVRIGELLDLKKTEVNLEEHWFKVNHSKTENGIRTVPIAKCIYKFFCDWCNSDSEYVIHKDDNQKFTYRNYFDTYFQPIMEKHHYNQTPHCCRHTCISLLAEAKVDQTTIKKIVGHAGAMTLTERVYTHLDVKTLLDAVDKMYIR